MPKFNAYDLNGQTMASHINRQFATRLAESDNETRQTLIELERLGREKLKDIQNSYVRENIEIPVQIAGNIILFLTFLAISWYSFETRDLKELQKKQIELSIKPILNVFINHQKILYVENVTENFTKNINIKEIETKDNTYNFTIEPNYISKPHLGTPIKILKNGKDQINLNDFLTDISVGAPENEISTIITYEDIENYEHKAKFIIYNLDNIKQSKIKMVY